MKKFSLLAVSALLIIVSCQEELEESAHVYKDAPVFEAAVESFENQTKTSLAENNSIVWTDGDEISIFRGNTLSYRYRLADGFSGQSNASFSVVNEGGNDFYGGNELAANIAFYPYSSGVSASATSKGFKLSGVVLPATQNYSAESFGNGSFAMVAVTRNLDDHILSFRNVLGTLKLQLKGLCTVKSITITGNRGEVLSGEAEIIAGVDVYEPSISMKNTTGTSVTLNCGTGVALNTSTPTEFFIALPPVTFSEGFTVEVKDTDNMVYTLEADVVNVIQRSYILNMPVVTLENGEVAEVESTDPIEFADENIKARCVELYDTNNDGELSYMEAAAVTTLNGLFNTYTKKKYVYYNFETGQAYESEGYTYVGQTYRVDQTTFDELQYFTGLDEIDPYAFSNCPFTSIKLPQGIKKIGVSALESCPVTSLEFPEGIKEIRSIPQYLTSLVIPDGVTILYTSYLNIGGILNFNGQQINNNVADYYISLPKTLKQFNLNISYHYNFTGTVTYGGSALASDEISFVNEDGLLFYFNSENLTEYVIPEGVKNIGWSYRYNSNRSPEPLKSVTFPQTLMEPTSNVFAYFAPATEFDGKYMTSDGKAMISGNKLIGVVPSVEEYDIPETITSIGAYAFRNCTNLTTVTLPAAITELPPYCFSYCANLETINLEKIKILGESAFYNCNKLLTRFMVPANIEEIGYCALYKSYGSSILEFQSSIPPVLKSGWELDNDTGNYVLATTTFSPQTIVYVPDLSYAKYSSFVYSDLWPNITTCKVSELYAPPVVETNHDYDDIYLQTSYNNSVQYYRLKRVHLENYEGTKNTFTRKHPSTGAESTVTITGEYYIGEFEFPQGFWKAIMHSCPSRYIDDIRPVEGISAEECLAFIDKLNELTGMEFRLPTEAEWEFAARGGAESEGYTFAGSNNYNDVYASRAYDGGPDAIRTMIPNELGLYNMNGNVFEYCSDYFYDWQNRANPIPSGENPYVSQTQAQTYAQKDLGLVIRGGDVNSYITNDGFIGHRENRYYNTSYAYQSSSYPYEIIGFRLAMSVPAEMQH